MFKRNLVLAGITALFAVSFFTFPSQAHGHGCGSRRRITAVSASAASSVVVTTPVAAPAASSAVTTPVAAPAASSAVTAPVAAPAASSAVTAYPVCTVAGCTEAGRHIHDGNYYCGYAHSGGYCDNSCIGVGGYTGTAAPAPVVVPAPVTTYPVCTIAGCTEVGRHIHDGNYYCGYGHSSGYCDNSCSGAGSYNPGPSTGSYYSSGGHHRSGWHH